MGGPWAPEVGIPSVLPARLLDGALVQEPAGI